MSQNGMTSLDWFEGNTNSELRVVNLSHNSVYHIPSKLFKSNLELYSLDLSYNKLTSLNKEAFYNLNQLV